MTRVNWSVAGAVAMVFLAGVALNTGTRVCAPNAGASEEQAKARQGRGYSPKKLDERLLLPAGSIHAFRPVRKEWTPEVSYLIDRGHSFQVIKPQDRDPESKLYYRQVRYHTSPKGKRPARMLRYHPSGHVVSQSDWVGKQQFSRCFYPDGSIRSYLHWRDRKWIAGYTVGPDGKAVQKLTDGSGLLEFHGRAVGGCTKKWYHKGSVFLTRQYSRGKLVETHLTDGDGWLILRDGKESLSLDSRGEHWTKTQGRVSVQVMDSYIDGSTGKIHMRPVRNNDEIRRLSGSRIRRRMTKEQAEGLERERQEMYRKRLKEFLRTYRKLARKAGYSLRGLGLEAIGVSPATGTPQSILDPRPGRKIGQEPFPLSLAGTIG